MSKSNWEDELEQLGKRYSWHKFYGIDGFNDPIQHLKSFISNLIQEARNSERSRILDLIEKKKRFVPTEPETIEEIRNEGFNKALDEIKREVEK